MNESWEIRNRSGPEDNLEAVMLDVNSTGLLTAGSDWTIRLKPNATTEGLYYKDLHDFERIKQTAYDPDSIRGKILKDIATGRNLCAVQDLNISVCEAGLYAHQYKQCAPALTERLKCHIKLGRAVETLCRKQFFALESCLKKNDNSKPACIDDIISFDRCVEDF